MIYQWDLNREPAGEAREAYWKTLAAETSTERPRDDDFAAAYSDQCGDSEQWLHRSQHHLYPLDRPGTGSNRYRDNATNYKTRHHVISRCHDNDYFFGTANRHAGTTVKSETVTGGGDIAGIVETSQHDVQIVTKGRAKRHLRRRLFGFFVKTLLGL